MTDDEWRMTHDTSPRVIRPRIARQERRPLAGELLIRPADRALAPLQVIQPEPVDAPRILPQGGVPVHLVGQAVPGKANDRDPVLPEPDHRGPLLPEPGHGVL